MHPNGTQTPVSVRGCRDRDRMVVGLQLPMQSVPITTDVVCSNPDQGGVYNIM
jgi:hypothetical protein